MASEEVKRAVGEGPAGPWPEYLAWNKAIASVVFSEEAGGRPVYLDLEPEVLGRLWNIVAPTEDSPTDIGQVLLDTVAQTLGKTDQHASVFSSHLGRLNAWYSEGRHGPPPTLALLAAFSTVAENMERTAGMAASNYYDRLTAALGFEEKKKEKIGRDYRSAATRLWESLNTWLRDNEGRRGLPTAFAFDRRVYVGLPMSQALVRAQDRRRFPQLFVRYGLQPGQNISFEEMRSLLFDWLPHSSVTPSLRRLWKQSAAAREQIADVACSELAAWDGSIPDGLRSELPTTTNLYLAAELRHRPYTQVEILAITNAYQAKEEIPLTSEGQGGMGGTPEHRHEGTSFNLVPLPGTDWMELRADPPLSMSRVLLGNLSLRTRSSGTAILRGVRKVVLLKRNPATGLYVETHRAELLEQYLLLAHASVAPNVREILTSAARAGYEEHCPQSMPGLPAGWVSFSRVQLENIPDAEGVDVAPLKPLAKSHLVIDGGLPLPGLNTWHVRRPPEVRVVASDETPDLELWDSPLELLDDDAASEVLVKRFEHGGIVDLAASAETSKEGDHRLILRTGSYQRSRNERRRLATAAYRLRSGSSPRPLTNERDQRPLGYRLNEAELLDALPTRLQWEQREPALLGAFWLGDSRLHRFEDGPEEPRPLPSEPFTRISELDHAERNQPPVSGAAATEEPAACIARGYHTWRLDSVPPNPRQRPSRVYKYCLECGLESWHERSGTLATRQSSASSLQRATRPSRKLHLPQIESRSTADMDLLLDSLSYAQAGAWRELERLALEVDDSPWFPREAARALQALGHMETEFSSSNLHPTRWATAPTALISNSAGRHILCGQRSHDLLSALRAHVEMLEGTLTATAQEFGPALVEVLGLSVKDVDLIASDLTEHGGHTVRRAWQVERSICHRMPHLSTVRASLPRLTTGIEPEKYLDLEAGCWVRASKLGNPGAYRLLGRPVTYVVVPPAEKRDSGITIADARTAKYLAAMDAGVSLIGYNANEEELTTPRAAPLPLLFDRVAVLCMGVLPTETTDGLLRYRGVPEDIARGIWTRLTQNT